MGRSSGTVGPPPPARLHQIAPDLGELLPDQRTCPPAGHGQRELREQPLTLESRDLSVNPRGAPPLHELGRCHRRSWSELSAIRGHRDAGALLLTQGSCVSGASCIAFLRSPAEGSDRRARGTESQEDATEDADAHRAIVRARDQLHLERNREVGQRQILKRGGEDRAGRRR